MLYKRGPVWWLDVRVNGKRVRKSLHTDERAVALARARDVELELRKPRPPGTPFAEFAEKYKAWALTSKPASYRSDCYNLAVIKSWLDAEGLLSLESITTHDVERLRAALLARPIGKRTGRTMSRATANRHLALLRAMFNKAADWGDYAGVNPVSKVRFYREGAKIRPLTDGQVSQIVAAADTLAGRKYATPLQQEFPRICRLILNTGLRRSEALMLRWADVGDDAIVVRGKGGKSRSVPLNAEARAVLKNDTNVPPKSTYFVFDVPGRSSPSLLRRITERIAVAIGRPFNLHLLRHKFASDLLARGVDVVTISQLLGHSAFMTTLLYSHSNPGLMRRAVDTLSATEQADAGHTPGK